MHKISIYFCILCFTKRQCYKIINWSISPGREVPSCSGFGFRAYLTICWVNPFTTTFLHTAAYWCFMLNCLILIKSFSVQNILRRQERAKRVRKGKEYYKKLRKYRVLCINRTRSPLIRRKTQTLVNMKKEKIAEMRESGELPYPPMEPNPWTILYSTTKRRLVVILKHKDYNLLSRRTADFALVQYRIWKITVF